MVSVVASFADDVPAVVGVGEEAFELLPGGLLESDDVEGMALDDGADAWDARLPVVGGGVAGCQDVEGGEAEGGVWVQVGAFFWGGGAERGRQRWRPREI